MSQDPSQSALTEEVRFRVPLPIVIPVVSLIVIAGVAFGFSQILLSVPKEVAVIVALAVAANVLIVCTVIALRPDTVRRTWPELVIVATYPLFIGIMLTQIGLADEHSAGEHAAASEGGAEGSGEAAGGGGASISAAGVVFDSDTLELTAGEETELEFVNDDTVEHNVAIYETEAAEQDLFVGDIIPGGQETTYSIPALETGEFCFQCDVHPNMNGTVTVE